MPKSLVIVESDAKSKTINRFLGSDYIVKASVGHIKNLPKNRLGVDIDNGFDPEYITIRGRGKILRELKGLASKVDEIYLATDPDREGEAIAYHLANEIKNVNSNIHRVLFYEITNNGIKNAIKNPGTIDMNKVEAQKARRVMDRLVGYKVSPFLWKTVFRGLSAGRVQTVALRLVCEREKEIASFKPREYWSLEAEFKTKDNITLRAKLLKIGGEDFYIPNEAEMKKHISVLKKLEYFISDVKSKTIERRPPPPFTTSTLQQDSARKFGMSTKQIMAIAQQLYEGIDLPEGRVGLITYMRTDSTRLAKSAVEEARKYIAEGYGLEYVPSKPNVFRNKKSVQDAHEAIRPTSLKRPPNQIAAYLTAGQKKLYELIWKRFIASQMAPAKILQKNIDITSGKYLFRATGSIVQFKGFMQLYDVDRETEETLPDGVMKHDRVELLKLDPEQHFTKPPPRYNESSLVKELDNLGIGRPSTYALIISTLLDRKYCRKEGRALHATELGMAVNEILIDQFPDIFNVGFTAAMEEELDQIESGEKERVSVLKDFYEPFSRSIQNAMEMKEQIKQSLLENRDEKCPECGRDLVIKWGRNGRFIACTGYPECRYSRSLDEELEQTDQKCEECGSPMVIRMGRYGRFMACSRYPECKFTRPLSTGVKCPNQDCGGEIVEKKSRRGKTFFGCSNYPSCNFASWYRPVLKECKKCGNYYLEERHTKKKGSFYRCPVCGYETQ